MSRGGSNVLHVNLTPGTSLFSLDLVESASFDREGRLLYCFFHGETFKRSLASDIFRRARQDGRRWDLLGHDEANDLITRAYALAGRARRLADGEAAERLDREILGWTATRLQAERSRFDAVYRPVSILPPDCYQTIVLQATDGCSWNRCTFCSFYMDRPFAVRSASEFEAHVDGVLRFLGRGAAARRGVFLADGNALAVGLAHLAPLVAIARDRLPGHRLFGFVDLFSGERRPVEHWHELARLGLARVYVGMETGDDELLAFVNKPGSQDELVEFVAELKQAGVAVGLIAIVGLGGRDSRARHRGATVAALERMSLEAGDLVYLSPLVERPGDAYETARERRGWRAMDAREVEAELRIWRATLSELGIRSSRYDIREFVY